MKTLAQKTLPSQTLISILTRKENLAMIRHTVNFLRNAASHVKIMLLSFLIMRSCAAFLLTLVSILPALAQQPDASKSQNSTDEEATTPNFAPFDGLYEWHYKASYEHRLVRNIAEVNLAEISTSKAIWVIAKTAPYRTKPSRLGPAELVNPETGRSVKSPKYDPVILAHGGFEILKILAGQPPILKDYEWEIPQQFDLRPNGMVEMWETYSPFIFFGVGGTIIVKINPESDGDAKFRPAYVIPPEWIKFVEPALTFHRANPDLFRADLAAQNIERLRPLLTHDNPFVAIASARALLGVEGADMTFFGERVATSRGLRQAAFTHLLLKFLVPRRQQVAAVEISKTIDSTTSADQLQNVVVGLYATTDRNLYSLDRSLHQLRHELLGQAAKKFLTFESQSAASAYIRTILEREDILKPAKRPQ